MAAAQFADALAAVASAALSSSMAAASERGGGGAADQQPARAAELQALARIVAALGNSVRALSADVAEIKARERAAAAAASGGSSGGGGGGGSGCGSGGGGSSASLKRRCLGSCERAPWRQSGGCQR